MGHFKVRLWQVLQPSPGAQAATPRWWQRQLSTIPEHVLILLYERLMSHGAVANPVTNFRISTVSSWSCY